MYEGFPWSLLKTELLAWVKKKKMSQHYESFVDSISADIDIQNSKTLSWAQLLVWLCMGNR